jgi:Plasmid pRiA4b ORF-3-like protein
MATKRINTAEDIYQIKVTLLGTKPPIWRRLLVPAHMTLAQLHDVLQIAMGWQNGHMHEFRIGRRYFGKPDPEYRTMGMDPVENERTVRLPDVLRKTGPKLIYTYDLGDSWEHSIVLEKQLPVDPTAKYPVCTDGQLACPPEDCGGIPGFYDLVEAIADPNHEQHKELKDWLGYVFDPIDFSIDSVNQMLLPARRRGKTAKK